MQGANVERRVFDPLGHVQDLQKADGTWVHFLPDALGSVRGVINDAEQLLHSQLLNPIGQPWGTTGTFQTEFGFTGEPTEGTGLVYLRARHYNPMLGVFPNLDPIEGDMGQPMALNRYMYVQGNVPNATDSSGMIFENPGQWDRCLQQQTCDCLQHITPPNLDLNKYKECLRRCPSAPLTPTRTPVPPPKSCQECHEICRYSEFWCLQYNDDCVKLCAPTVTPTSIPTATPVPTVIIFFGGSDGVNITQQGPDPRLQTPTWNALANLTIRYPGSKSGQASQAAGYNNYNIIVIGYSAGADTALIFADNYLKTNQGTGKITDVVVLGGSMTGTMMNGSSLANEWPNVLNALLSSGTDVYILDDKAAGGNEAAGYTKPAGAAGTFTFDQRLTQEHWDGGTSGQFGIGTNNSQAYVAEVMNWVRNN